MFGNDDDVWHTADVCVRELETTAIATHEIEMESWFYDFIDAMWHHI